MSVLVWFYIFCDWEFFFGWFCTLIYILYESEISWEFNKTMIELIFCLNMKKGVLSISNNEWALVYFTCCLVRDSTNDYWNGWFTIEFNICMMSLYENKQNWLWILFKVIYSCFSLISNRIKLNEFEIFTRYLEIISSNTFILSSLLFWNIHLQQFENRWVYRVFGYFQTGSKSTNPMVLYV